MSMTASAVHEVGDVKDYARTAPATLAGRYLRMFWQPICVGSEVPAGRALPVRLMGEDFTLYRGEGGLPHLVGFRCAHRGEQLSTGKVEQDCIRCFYHGWKYDEHGQCVEQPAEDSRSAAKVRVGGYPTHEALGLIYAFIGDGDPPPFPVFPGFDDWEPLFAHVTDYSFNYFQSFENAVDLTHTSFVHEGSHDYSEEILKLFPRESLAGITMVGRRSGDITFIAQLGMPNVFHMNFPLPPPVDSMKVILIWVPVDDTSHRIIAVLRIPHEAGELMGPMMRLFTDVKVDPAQLADEVLAGKTFREDVDLSSTIDIRFQDIVAQKGQGLIADRTSERLGRGDLGIIMLRKLWTAELRKVAAGEAITEWLPPSLGPVSYYEKMSDDELEQVLETSALLKTADASRG